VGSAPGWSTGCAGIYTNSTPHCGFPARGLRSYCVIDRLGEQLATFTGLVARLARELLHPCRELTMQIGHTWLGGAVRGDDPG
jgi:hypothetical protein